MKIINFIIFTAIFISCGQNENQQKELEIKEREIALREKEFALKESDTEKLKLQANVVNDNPLTVSTEKVSEFATIIEIITSKGKYPIVQLSDKIKENEINSFICKKVFGKIYSISNLKPFIEIENWDKSNYSNCSQVNYKIKSNTSAKLVIYLATCFLGAAENCEEMEFTINPITGNKNVKFL